ncbi:MAG: hypothetical protein ACOX6T_21020 [Myxococcales bacterium]|jgi:hypothetical protein
MTSVQLPLSASAATSSNSPASAFTPTREVFSGPPGWGEQTGAESRLDRIFRERSEEQWALVRAHLATAESARQQAMSAENAGAAAAAETPTAAPEAEDDVAAFQPPPALALRPPDFEVKPLDFVEAGPYGRGVIYSVTPELGQAAVALEQGGVTVVALGALAKVEEDPTLVGLRERVESLRSRLGLK